MPIDADPLDLPLNFREPNSLEMLRTTLRRFVEKEMPREEARRWDRENIFPREVFRKLADLGVMGLTVPEEYGGAGRDIVACMATIDELARRSGAVAVAYIMCACYAGMNLLDCATEEQKADLLPKVATGELIFAYGLTEPDVGSDLASVRTTAERRGDRVVVSGAKRFISGPHISSYIYTLVRSDREAPRYKNLSIVLIPPTAKGVTITPIDAMGLKGTPTTDVMLDEVEVPFDNVIGGEAGWNNAWEFLVGPGLDVEKLEVAALALGLAEAALGDAWSYSETRAQFGKPIATLQSVRHMLADARTKLHACRLVMLQAAWLADRRLPCRAETSMAKLFVSETAKEIVLSCQSVMGAYGYIREFDMERYVRESLLMPIIGGSSAIQRNNVANALGLARR